MGGKGARKKKKGVLEGSSLPLQNKKKLALRGGTFFLKNLAKNRDCFQKKKTFWMRPKKFWFYWVFPPELGGQLPFLRFKFFFFLAHQGGAIF